MAYVVCQAVLVASVKEVSWPSGKQNLDMDEEPWRAAKEEQSKVMTEDELRIKPRGNVRNSFERMFFGSRH